MKKILENLESAEKITKATDHLLYITFPIIKDKRVILKVISELKLAITHCINSILQYEYFLKRIRLSKDPQTNFKIFEEKCAENYNISKKEIELIMELFRIVEKQKKSPMEFLKNDKIIFMSEDMKPEIFTLEKTKEYLILTKNILKKTKERIEQSLR